MTPRQTVALLRLVRAVCPAQAIDEFTADTWTPLLADVRPADAEEAVRRLASRQPFVAPSELLDEVRRLRAERAERAYPPQPPGGLDGPAYLAWLRETNRRLGDGAAVPGLPGGSLDRPVRELLDGAFRTVPTR